MIIGLTVSGTAVDNYNKRVIGIRGLGRWGYTLLRVAAEGHHVRSQLAEMSTDQRSGPTRGRRADDVPIRRGCVANLAETTLLQHHHIQWQPMPVLSIEQDAVCELDAQDALQLWSRTSCLAMI
jgi:hypothetical protein